MINQFHVESSDYIQDELYYKSYARKYGSRDILLRISLKR